MSGVRLGFSPADLRATVAAYDPALHEAPLVVGHPKHDLPAYGWVQSLKFSDGSDADLPAGMYALPAQVNPDFADMVAAGAFKKISASFYAPDAPANPVPGVFYLRHVGLLGAQPPAIKGLRNPSFADAEEGVVEFNECSDAPAATPTPQSPPQESAVTEQEAALLREQNEAMRQRLAEMDAQHAAAFAEGINRDNTAFAEQLVAEARLLSTGTPVVVAMLNHLALASEPVEFGEGEARAPLAQALRQLLLAAPQRVEFGEAATRARAAADAATAAEGDMQFSEGTRVDEARMDLHRRATALAKEKGIPYFEAARQAAQG